MPDGYGVANPVVSGAASSVVDGATVGLVVVLVVVVLVVVVVVVVVLVVVAGRVSSVDGPAGVGGAVVVATGAGAVVVDVVEVVLVPLPDPGGSTVPTTTVVDGTGSCAWTSGSTSDVPSPIGSVRGMLSGDTGAPVGAIAETGRPDEPDSEEPDRHEPPPADVTVGVGARTAADLVASITDVTGTTGSNVTTSTAGTAGSTVTTGRSAESASGISPDWSPGASAMLVPMVPACHPANPRNSVAATNIAVGAERMPLGSVALADHLSCA